MKNRYVTAVLVGLTLVMLALSVPGSLREAHERGGFYTFSWAFLEDIPKRLTGPGRFRFIFQPLIAIILGILGGRKDAREGRPPFLQSVDLQSGQRLKILKKAFEDVINVLLMGILLDSMFQWVLYGNSYPGAALVVGPFMVMGPYVISREVTNRAFGQ